VYIAVVLMAVIGVIEVSLTIMREKELHLVLAYDQIIITRILYNCKSYVI
jgi:hypothetical protein